VNWALRQIGKRDLAMNAAAVETAKAIQQIDSPAARWTASDALREITGEKVQAKLRSG
jgi:3-methyladenine DNA glycosylase AlkD